MFLFTLPSQSKGGVSVNSEVVNVLYCEIAVSEFEHQSHYYVHFRTNTLGKITYFLFQHVAFKKCLYGFLQRYLWH